MGGELEEMVRAGDVAGARALICLGGSMHGGTALRLCAESDAPGMARMLASEGVVDVSEVVVDEALLRTSFALKELLYCGAAPPAGTPLERAALAALLDCRSMLAAAAVMMGMPREDMLAVLAGAGGESLAGAEMLARALQRASTDAGDSGGGGTRVGS